MTSLRQTLRHLVHRPVPTALSIVLLAAGVALAVSFWSVLDHALLRGLPFPGGDRIVAFSTQEAPGWPMALGDYDAIEGGQLTFEWTAPTRTFNTMLTRGEQTQGVIGGYVPHDLFDRLGAQPILGRGFTEADRDPARPIVALISHRLWQGTYGADPGILGETIILNREICQVIGVMAPGFRFPLRHDAWSVFGRPGRSWAAGSVLAIGALRPGVSLNLARQDLARMVAALDASESSTEGARDASLEPFARANIGDRARGGLHAMVYAALGLLALTCFNLANLRLSESLRRQDDLETRLALGARPLGLVKLLVLENLVLGSIAVVLGLGLAYLLIETIGSALLRGSTLARAFWIDPSLDVRAAGFAALCTLTATLFGALLPALWTLLRARRGRVGTHSQRTRTASWSRGLVSVQIGLCFALLVAAGLWRARAESLLDSDPGFASHDLSSLQISVYQANLDDEPSRRALFERLDQALDSDPAILDAALASASPWGYVPRVPVGTGSGDRGPDDTDPRAGVLEVSEGFFATLGLDLLAGRDFSAADAEDPDRPVAIISRSLADQMFADVAVEQTPIGQTTIGKTAIGQDLVLGPRRAGGPSVRLRIVGIAADLGVDRHDAPSRNLTVYRPAGVPVYGTQVLIRRRAGLASARPVLEDLLARTAPLVGILGELDVVEALDASIWVERRLGQIFSLFGVAAWALTAAGIYAVIVVLVRRRAREFGIRAAIGARPIDLERLVLGESGRQLVIGLGAGLVVLWAGSRVLDPVLTEGLAPRPAVLATAAAVITVCCLAGSWVPTRRAGRVEPVEVLSAE